MKIEYLTDIEGDLQYFKTCVDRSSILSFSEDDGEHLCFTENPVTQDLYFVFGGDLFDKGPGDIRLARMFVDFKDRHPDRVFWVLGNRDVNKLRFKLEVTDGTDPPKPFWDPKQIDYRTFLEDRPDTRVEKVKYILQYTMNAPKSFEYRREEMRIISNNPTLTPTDEAVSESFTVKNQFLIEYLEKGCLILTLQNTLFVHGCVPKAGLGFVPDLKLEFSHKGGDASKVPGKHYGTLSEWCAALEDFKQKALNEYKTNQGNLGRALMTFQITTGTVGKNIVVESWYSRGALSPPHSDVVKFFSENNITRVCTGHKPVGDTPLISPLSPSGAILFSMDTSMSNAKAPNRRDPAVFNLTLTPSSSIVTGRLIDCTEVSFTVEDHLEHIGKSKDGWWVRAYVASEGKYHLTKQDGYDLHQKRATAAELEGYGYPHHENI
eukprot:TRINITY_DN987_c3_g1_i1.p1 TRINITY_DN987_c3_g1~~TRINITY_DN987_c3_g1_i1.p1  ORF type:complete len:435 (+),score=68.91 TRINITY_DN987_c3_g1_i1:51-1355(+)